MADDPIADALAVVCIGRSPDVLQAVLRPGVQLAAWQREPNPDWGHWLGALPPDEWPVCRIELPAEQATSALQASFDACGTPSGPARDAWIADITGLVEVFAALAGPPRVRLRLDVVTGDACRRWHRDCVPLRLICTYRGTGTQWVPPAWGEQVLAQPDDDTPHALSLQAADVAVFKGCGWHGQAHDGGIVHRSPRIVGTGLARLVLVLDAAWPPSGKRSS